MTPLSNVARRRGAASRPLTLLAGSALLVALLTGYLLWSQPPASSKPLVVLCAASQRIPMDATISAYQRDFGRSVSVQYGPSQTLLTSLKLSGGGDLYLPADESYTDLARQEKLIGKSLPLVQMKPVLVVQKGNPKNVNSLTSLLASDAQIVQADPEVAAIGKVVREALTKSGQWEALKARTGVFKPNVQDAAGDLKLGSAYAGFVWDGMLQQLSELEMVPLPELEDVESKVSVAICTTSKQPEAALHFARYLAARDKGLVEFQRAGFTVVEGPAWQESAAGAAP